MAEEAVGGVHLQPDLHPQLLLGHDRLAPAQAALPQDSQLVPRRRAPPSCCLDTHAAAHRTAPHRTALLALSRSHGAPPVAVVRRRLKSHAGEYEVLYDGVKPGLFFTMVIRKTSAKTRKRGPQPAIPVFRLVDSGTVM